MADKPFFVAPLALGTITCGNERSNRPASHLGEHLYRGMVWQSSGNSNLWVRCDLGAAQAIDYVGLLGTNAQPGTTFRVRLGDSQSEVDGTADYDSGVKTLISPTPATVPARGYHSHLEIPSVQTERWLRIDIGGHTGDFSAAMLVIGRKVSPATYYEPQWQRSVRDLGGITFNRNGVAGVTPGEKMRAAAWKMAWVSESEFEEKFAPMDEALGKSKPLLACFDPAPTSYRQARTYFGPAEDNPGLNKVGFNRFEKQFQILSLF